MLCHLLSHIFDQLPNLVVQLVNHVTVSVDSPLSENYVKKEKNYTFIPTSLFRDYSLFMGF